MLPFLLQNLQTPIQIRGGRLEEQIAEVARGSTRLLGPNGMGLYYPRIGLAWRPHFPTLEGTTTLICQSGGIANLFIYGAGFAGLGLTKVFSFGNGADLHLVELIDYAAHDPETKTIVAYIEGIRAGEIPHLREILTTIRKPFIAVKGGKSSAGIRAAHSHTASFAGSHILWESFFKQYGVIQTDCFDDLIEICLALDAFGGTEYKMLPPYR